MKRASAFVFAASIVAGCSLPQNGAKSFAPQNTCSSTSDCSGGAVCVNEMCVATDVDLTGLLIEVRPNSNAAFGATTSHIFDPADANIPLRSSSGPFLARMDPQIPPPVAIRDGRIRLHPDTQLEQGCMIGADRTIPAAVTFYRVASAPFTGFVFEPVSATTDTAGLLSVDLLPGVYDVYVEPRAVMGCNGDRAFPPVFRPGVEIAKDATSLLLDLPITGTITGTILDAAEPTLDGWTLDLLEPSRGLPISRSTSLTSNMAGGYAVLAQISWPDTDAPILRVSPPHGTAQPTAYWSLSVVGCTKTNPCVELSTKDLFKAPVKVTGNVLGEDGFTRVRASLSIQSTELQGPNKENASFAIAPVDTDENGLFSLLLPPGKYDFRAIPADEAFPITDATFSFTTPGATCFCGQPFLLSSKLPLTGSVKTPSGSWLADAPVFVKPSQLSPRNYWASTHSLPSRTAREISTASASDGSFSLDVDPGLADLVVEPDVQTGFPWLVRPRFDASSGAQLEVTYPAILSGRVRDPSGVPVANAEVTAWFPVRDAGRGSGLSDTIVKIAITSTDADGNYTLLLPASM